MPAEACTAPSAGADALRDVPQNMQGEGGRFASAIDTARDSARPESLGSGRVGDGAPTTTPIGDGPTGGPPVSPDQGGAPTGTQLSPDVSAKLASIVNGTAGERGTEAGVQGLTDFLLGLSPTADQANRAAATEGISSVMEGLQIARNNPDDPQARALVNSGIIEYREASGSPIANADEVSPTAGSAELLGQWADDLGNQNSQNYLPDFLAYLGSTGLSLN